MMSCMYSIDKNIGIGASLHPWPHHWTVYAWFQLQDTFMHICVLTTKLYGFTVSSIEGLSYLDGLQTGLDE